VIVIIGSVLFSFGIKKESELSTFPVVETTQVVSENEDVEWKTYRNEKLDFEFKYPIGTQITYSDEAFLSEEGEATEAVRLRKGADDLVYINRLSNFDIDAYRNHWKELDAIATNGKEPHISRGEYLLLTDNPKGIRFDFCSYTLAGVNCDIIFSHHLFLLVDGSYIMVKINSWQYSEETMAILSGVAKSFRTDLAE
jgi:hypothetical protein